MQSIPITHPARRALLGDQLRRNAARLGDCDAIVAFDGAQRHALSYAELDEQSERLAAALRRRGVGAGAVVALLGRNSPALLVAFWGAVKAGAAVTGANPTFTAQELCYQLAHSRARAVVAAAGETEKIDALAVSLPELAVHIAAQPTPPSGWEALEELCSESAPAPAVELELGEDAPALIPYTSGTTARPKAVVLTHRNYLLATVPAYQAGVGMRERDRFYYVMPLHTMAGLGTQVSLLCTGATVILPGTPAAEAALEIIAGERVSIIAQTPTFYLQLSRAPAFSDCDLRCLERLVTYGGTMPRAMFDAFAAAAPGVRWITLWSQSEIAQTPTVGWFSSLQDIPGGDPAWIGRPTPQLEVRVIDEDGREAAEGELLCRTPGMMLGYLDDPQRTAEALRGGWLHTGDLVRRDAQGNLFFVDRRHDVIKSGGMNVSSVEVERVLYRHPVVLEAAVVGLADEYWGQAVTAFVVAVEGQRVDAEVLIAFAREHLAAFKVPKAVRFVSSLPKDAQGKILKRQLRAASASGG